MTSMPVSRSGRGLGVDARSSIVGADWGGYVPVKVKSFWSLALCGTASHQLPGLLFSQAVGAIRIVGARSGHTSTSLWIGFSRGEELPAPQFSLESDDAVGAMVLPGGCFGAWLEVLKSPQAYFRIGGDGRGNALASELDFLEAVPG